MPTEDLGNNNHQGVSFYLTMSYVNKELWNKVPEKTRNLIIGFVVVIIMEAYMNALTILSLYDSNFVSVFPIDGISRISVVSLILSRAVV